MLFQVLCGFEPIFYTTHPNEESIYFKYDVIIGFTTYIVDASCNYNNKMPECMLSNQLTFRPRILHFCKK